MKFKFERCLQAVYRLAAAYGWPENLIDRAQPENPNPGDRKDAEEEILKRLFALNQQRAGAGRSK
jgi:hypothetical protein